MHPVGYRGFVDPVARFNTMIVLVRDLRLFTFCVCIRNFSRTDGVTVIIIGVIADHYEGRHLRGGKVLIGLMVTILTFHHF